MAILERISQIAQKLDHCESNVTTVCERVKLLADKVDDLENCSRQCNILVYGVAEDKDETPDVLKKKVMGEIFQSKLGVKVESEERIHRLGRRKFDKPRPVIMRFFDCIEKC